MRRLGSRRDYPLRQITCVNVVLDLRTRCYGHTLPYWDGGHSIREVPDPEAG